MYAGTTSVTLVQVAAVSEFVELGLAENEVRDVLHLKSSLNPDFEFRARSVECRNAKAEASRRPRKESL